MYKVVVVFFYFEDLLRFVCTILVDRLTLFNHSGPRAIFPIDVSVLLFQEPDIDGRTTMECSRRFPGGR